jgi:hypothetical protein
MWHSCTTVLLIVQFQFWQLPPVYFDEIWWSVVFFSIGINEFEESIFLKKKFTIPVVHGFEFQT